MRNAFVFALALLTPARVLAAPYALEASLRPAPARGLASAPDGTVLVAREHSVIRIDPASRATLQTYPLPAPDDEDYIDAVAALGDDVLIGLPYVRRAPDEARFGVVYLLDGITGAVRHVFTSPVPSSSPAGNQFGIALAAAGDDVLVGAPLERSVHRFDGTTGALEQTYVDPGSGTEPFGSPFGTTVLAIADAVIVGAPADRAVHVFDAATGALRHTIADPRPASSPYSFGIALAALGSELLVGAPTEGVDPGGPAVFAYEPATGALLRAFETPASTLGWDGFGRAIAVDGSRVLAGAPGYAGHHDRESIGAVHVFDATSGLWLATIHNPTPRAAEDWESEYFGSNVAAVAGRVLIADPRDHEPYFPVGGLYVYVDVTACGDGVLGPLEVCDDGNQIDGDGCDANCRPTGCGNGVTTAGEVCDDGNLTDGDGCDANCMPTGCGNGVVSEPEQCDDGNLLAGDGCSPRCTIEVCGNGLLDPGESCDDGNTADGDGCSAGCQPEPRDHFACYRARGDKLGRRVTVRDAFGERAAILGRPVAFCRGDALTAPGAELTCYRAKHQRGAPRSVRRTVATGETSLRVTRVRTVCLPSDGSRIFRLARTFTDPTPPVEPEFGISVAGAAGRVVVGAPRDGGFQGGAHVFDGATGAFERTLCCGFRFFGLEVADAGRGQVLVATVDDNSYLYDVATGLRLRTFVGPGPRTPVAERPMAAVGRWVLSGDPHNHGSGFSFAGAVHVFDRATGARLRTLYAPEPAAFGNFGRAVAALGDQALVAQSDRVYLLDPAAGTALREFPYSTRGAEAVAGVGRHVLIGSPAYGAPGEATLLDADTGAVVRALHDDLGAANDRFGAAVDSAAGAFIVGAPGAPRLLPGAGAVHLFDAANGSRLHTLLNPDPAQPAFGARVAAMGDDLLVSSVREQATGAVHHFRGGPLDAFACYDARAASREVAAGVQWVGDVEAVGPVRIGRTVAVCTPAGRDGGAIAHPEAWFACRSAGDGGGGAREVTVRHAFGSATLLVSKRTTVCLPGPTS